MGRPATTSGADLLGRQREEPRLGVTHQEMDEIDAGTAGRLKDFLSAPGAIKLAPALRPRGALCSRSACRQVAPVAKSDPISLWDESVLGDSSTVEQRTLTPLI